VRRQPELGIEHSLQHDERVAVKGKKMGYQKCQETNDGGDNVAQSKPINHFE
jgi:hypothetical protein